MESRTPFSRCRRSTENICANRASSAGSMSVASTPEAAIAANTIQAPAREVTNRSGTSVTADGTFSHSSSRRRDGPPRAQHDLSRWD
jgi:hypothetical protein